MDFAIPSAARVFQPTHLAAGRQTSLPVCVVSVSIKWMMAELIPDRQWGDCSLMSALASLWVFCVMSDVTCLFMFSSSSPWHSFSLHKSEARTWSKDGCDVSMKVDDIMVSTPGQQSNSTFCTGRFLNWPGSTEFQRQLFKFSKIWGKEPRKPLISLSTGNTGKGENDVPQFSVAAATFKWRKNVVAPWADTWKYRNNRAAV